MFGVLFLNSSAGFIDWVRLKTKKGEAMKRVGVFLVFLTLLCCFSLPPPTIANGLGKIITADVTDAVVPSATQLVAGTDAEFTEELIKFNVVSVETTQVINKYAQAQNIDVLVGAAEYSNSNSKPEGRQILKKPMYNDEIS